MQEKIAHLHDLTESDISVLLRLYYQQERIEDGLEDESSLQRLLDQQLISSMIPDDALVSLTDQGLRVCTSLLQQLIQQAAPVYRRRVAVLPQQAVSCAVNRLLWRNSQQHSVEQLYSSEQMPWFEAALLSVPEMQQVIGGLYMVLESLGLAFKVDGQWHCPPEVESFLTQEYKDVVDISWFEEESLKYYYFFSVYASNQRHIIDVSSCDSKYQSFLFYGDTASAHRWIPSALQEPEALLQQLDISKKQLQRFLTTMQQKGVVEERYYPVSPFACFTDDDTIFVIKDISRYMEFISEMFLTPVRKGLFDQCHLLKG